MKTITFLSAYKKCEIRKASCIEHRRKRRFGIATLDDMEAREWQRLDRIASKCWRRIYIRITAADALAENDIERLRIKRDGDAYLVHLDNFVDLQESPAVFLNGDSWQGKILSEWWEATPLIHLPFIELIRIVNSLREYREVSNED